MGVIAYTCPFVPMEWIAAHGLTPSRFTPSLRDRRRDDEGACPFMSAFVSATGTMPDAAGIVVTTVCDQMRRGYELLKSETAAPTFLMNVPATWQTPSAQRLYVSELRRLGAFLIGCGGVAPSPAVLSRAMKEYDDTRTKLRHIQSRQTARQFSEAIADFHRSGSFPEPCGNRPLSLRGTPVALIGGPLFREHLEILDLVTARGGAIVLDGSETGERTLARAFGRSRLAADPLLELADAYFGTIPEVWRRPNSTLYEWLRRMLPLRQVRGVILVRQVWCDLWHAELGRLKDLIDLPVLDIDTAGDFESEENRTAGRIGAFLEMLQ